MKGRHSRLTVALCGGVAILAGIASGAGVLLRGDLATRPFTTVRGDTFPMLTNGIYRFNGENIASEGIGWDIVTLLLVVPAMLLMLPALRRGSLKATLVTTGLLGYFLYQYFEYATFLAFGPLFPVYVAITGLSVTALALVIANVDLTVLPDRFGPRFPRRGVVGFGIFMAVLLAGMWLPLIAARLTENSVPELHGATALVVQAFDLGLLVPLGLLTAAAVHRRLAVGYLLAAVVVVKGAAMGTAIVAMLIVEGAVTGAMQLPPIVIFAATALFSAYLGTRVLLSVDARDAGVRPLMAHHAPARS
jgi:hypothetical protein